MGKPAAKGSAEPYPRAKLWIPAGIATAAAILSLLQGCTQRAALDKQDGQLETQRAALEKQGEQLQSQREAVAAQRQALQDAQNRWQADGPNLETVLDLVGENIGDSAEGMPHYLGYATKPKPAPPNPISSDSRYLRKSDYQYDHLYLQILVANSGRSPGLIIGIDAVAEFSDPLNVEGEILLGKAECASDGNVEVTYSPCIFPLPVGAPGFVRMRVEISDYLNHGFACAGQGPGVITLWMHTPDKPDSESTQLAVSNYRQCRDPLL